MDKEKFIKELKEIMDTEEIINLDTKLSDIEEWDSLSLVSFMSFCSVKLGRPVMPNEVKAAQTVRDLFKIVGGN